MNLSVLRRVLFIIAVVAILASAAWAAPTFKVLYSFQAEDYPDYQLLLDPAGNLYGVTGAGGLTADCYGSGCGIVFELSPRSGRWAESELYGFPQGSTPYVYPSGPLVRDGAGDLFGATMYGGDATCNCGQLYQLSRGEAGWTETTLHNFVGGSSDGSQPQPGLVEDKAGNFYGATGGGGNTQLCGGGCGTIYELSRTSGGAWTESLAYEFINTGGYNPIGPLAIDAAGNIYGMTSSGGVYGWGTAFKLTKTNGVWTQSTLFDFTIDPNEGSLSFVTGLAVNGAGDLFAESQYGGANQVGELYELTPTKTGIWNFTMIHTFSGDNDGGYPYGGLSVDQAGNLYGTTIYGGSYEEGTVFKFTPGKGGQWSESVLHNFTGGTDGAEPMGGVILDSLGNVYGTTPEGGANGDGIAFEITQ